MYLSKHIGIELFLVWTAAFFTGNSLSTMTNRLPSHIRLSIILIVAAALMIWVIIEIRNTKQLDVRLKKLNKEIAHLNQQVKVQSRLLNDYELKIQKHLD